MSMRLHKFLAHAGVGSRRVCEEYILQGRVSVNGKTITILGTQVGPGDEVRFDGDRVRPANLIYLAVNKPRGVVCSNSHTEGRPRVFDLVPHVAQRLFCVGRLDADSSGLVILTNDGTLTQRLTHPRFRVPKRYEVRVRGKVTAEVLEQLRKGVYLAEGRVQCDRVSTLSAGRDSSSLLIEIHQGINREIRRVLAKVGFPVSELRRVAVDGLELGGLRIGGHRKLTPGEVRGLYALAPSEVPGPKPARSRVNPRRKR